MACRPPAGVQDVSRVACRLPAGVQDVGRMACRLPAGVRDVGRMARRPPAGVQDVGRMARRPPAGGRDVSRPTSRTARARPRYQSGDTREGGGPAACGWNGSYRAGGVWSRWIEWLSDAEWGMSRWVDRCMRPLGTTSLGMRSVGSLVEGRPRPPRRRRRSGEGPATARSCAARVEWEAWGPWGPRGELGRGRAASTSAGGKPASESRRRAWP